MGTNRIIKGLLNPQWRKGYTLFFVRLKNRAFNKFTIRKATDRKIKGLQELVDKKTRQLASKATWDDDEVQQDIVLTQIERLQKTIEILRKNKPRLYNPAWTFALSFIVLAALTIYLVTATAPSTDIALKVRCNHVSFDWQDIDTELLTSGRELPQTERELPQIDYLLLDSAKLDIDTAQSALSIKPPKFEFVADSVFIESNTLASGPALSTVKITGGST